MYKVCTHILTFTLFCLVALQAVEEKSQDQEQGGGNDTLEEDLTKEAETPDKEDVCGANIATHTESKMEVTVAQLKVKSKIPTVPSPSTISPAPGRYSTTSKILYLCWTITQMYI